MIFLSSYTGQTADELFALEATHRVDSLVLAFEEAMQQKAARVGLAALSQVERDVLAIEALEREVNNGGYSQFFFNASVEHALHVAPALERCGCPLTAAISAKALAAFGFSGEPTLAAIEQAMGREDDARASQWSACDAAYYGSGEDIAGRLFAYLKRHRDALSLA